MSSGAHAKMDLRVDDLICESSSGAGMELMGEANTFSASSSSGSDIRAYDLTAKECKADASSGSDIKLHVTHKFQGRASSGADIKFRGNPEDISKNDNSGGSVRQIKS